MEALTKHCRRLKTQFNLRLEPELLTWLKEEAKKHDRPVNYVIIHAIKQFRKSQEL